MGPEFASLLWLESLFRSFGNRRQVAAYVGLAPSPGVERDQGISKSGNRRLRHTMIELAWFWLRHQRDSALSLWFQARVGDGKGRVRRIAIVALARKLLVVLWRYVTNCSIFESKHFPPASAASHHGVAEPTAFTRARASKCLTMPLH
jgi:transposase